MQVRFVAVFGAGCLALLGCGAPGGSGGETDSDGGSTGTSETDTTETDTDTSETDTDTSETDTDGTCPTPLPPEAFDPDNQLSFGLWIGGLELTVGSSRQFQVGLSQCCYVWDPLETCSVYSIAPEVAGASIDPDTGLLTLTDAVPDGTELTVRADVEDGLAIVELPVFIYDPALHPLKGFWHEVARIPCGGGAEYAPDDPINELFFTASGELGVTWQPFEIYVDYWGEYVATPGVAGEISLSNLGGNYLPPDIDAEGSFALAGEELVLTDMWLGSSQESMALPGCGHRFTK